MLAHLEPARYNAIALGEAFAPAEEAHLRKCKWCLYLCAHTDANCFTFRRLLEIGLGDKLTDTERLHVRECPLCRWDYREIRKPSEPKPFEVLKITKY